MTQERGLFRSETLSQALSVYLPATALFRLVGLGRNVLLTWLMLNQHEFGLFFLALVVINLLTPLSSLGLNEAVHRYTPMYETRQMLRAFLGRVIPLVCAVAAVGSALLLWGNQTIGPALFQTVAIDPRLTALTKSRSIGLMQNVVWATFTLVVYFLAVSVMKGLRMYRALSLMELAHGLIFTAMAVATVLLGHRYAMAIVACYMMSLWIAMACFALPASLHLMLMPGQDAPLHGDPIIRRLLAFSLWAGLAAVMWQGLLHYPLWYLNRIHGSDAAGVFAAMRTITQYVVIAAVAISTVVMSAVTKIWESQGRQPADRLLNVSFKATSLLLLTGCVLVALLRHEIVLMFDPRYRGGAEVIPLLLLGFLTAGNLAFLAIHFNLIEKTRFLFWPWAVGLASNALLGLWMVKDLAASPNPDGLLWSLGCSVRPIFNCGAAGDVASAAWAGALALLIALAVCLVLLRVERRPLDVGGAMLAASAAILAFHWSIMVVVLVVLWGLTLRGEIVFSRDEKTLLRDRYRAFLHRRREPGAPTDTSTTSP
ncbi:MAG: lipopolysaccharide biosynthesis protein [Phycisphaerae bacterium]|nr:lipopolysaccharide biosynthesis protein [Phycisphaerae bacterium]